MHMTSLETLDDADLVQATLDGDARSFEVLVERYQRRLFGLLLQPLQLHLQVNIRPVGF